MSQDGAEPTNHKQAGNSFREAFPGYFPPGDELLQTFFTSGLVVFDTNPLLEAYKLTGTARTEFLNAMRALGDRLWIPHQVGLEFLRNRATVIGQSNGFSDSFRKVAGDLHKEVQKLQEHRGLKDEEVSGIKKDIDDVVNRILNTYAALYAFEVDPSTSVEDDPVFREIEQITAGKIGPPFSKVADVAKIGAQRLKDKVPPGYSDASKGAEGALGDYFVWEQTLIEAERRRQPVLFITNDSKEDWVRKEGSYKRGPRPELVDEMLARAGQPFHLMNVKSFLFHVRKYLHTEVSESTIEQAESVQRQAELAALRAAVRIVRARLENTSDINESLVTSRLLDPSIMSSRLDRTNLHNCRSGEDFSKSREEDRRQALMILRRFHGSDLETHRSRRDGCWIHFPDGEWGEEKAGNDIELGGDENDDLDD